MPRENRVSPEELQERYKIVQGLIVQGFNGSDCWRYIESETDWNISRRQCFNYFRDAFEALADDSNINRASYFKLCLERLERQFSKAEKKNDYREASKIVMYMVNFLKLDTPSADFDWTQAATASGINPVDLKERLKNLMIPDDGESESELTNGHG